GLLRAAWPSLDPRGRPFFNVSRSAAPQPSALPIHRTSQGPPDTGKWVSVLQQRGVPRTGPLEETTMTITATIEAPASPYLTLAQASEYLQIPQQTLKNWRVDGRGPRALKFGALLRYSREELDRWAIEQMESANRG